MGISKLKQYGFSIVLFVFYAVGFSQEYKIDQVNFIGTKNTKVSFLEKIVSVKAGKMVDSLVLETDINQLKKLPSIANATYVLQSNATTSYVVVFTIEENFTLIPFANVYTSSNDEFAFRIGLQEFNLTGRNIIIGGFYQKDVFDSYGVALRAPYLFNSKTGVALSYNNLKTQEPVFFDGTSAEYKYHNSSFEVMGLYQFNPKNSIGLGMSFFTENYNYLRGATNPSVPQLLDVNKFSYKALYNYDNITYDYQYLSGFKSVLNLQYVNSSNENSNHFLLGFTDLIYYKRVGIRGNWANRLRLGLATNDETPFAPFSVDNNVNLRGVGNLIDRGTGTIVINTEYRHTLLDENWFVLQGNTFIDGGTWRNPGGGYDDLIKNENVRIYPGIGIRFIHKRIFNAIFRIDYGYGVTKNASKGLVFGIGQYF